MAEWVAAAGERLIPLVAKASPAFDLDRSREVLYHSRAGNPFPKVRF